MTRGCSGSPPPRGTPPAAWTPGLRRYILRGTMRSAAFIGAVLLLPAIASAAGTGAVVIKTIDQKTHQRVPGVCVSVDIPEEGRTISCTSNRKGVSRLAQVPVGTRLVVVSRPGYMQMTFTVRVRDGSTQHITADLYPGFVECGVDCWDLDLRSLPDLSRTGTGWWFLP